MYAKPGAPLAHMLRTSFGVLLCRVVQSNIETTGFRSLREEEEVEFDLVIGEDGKKKAFHVTGPDGAPPLVSPFYCIPVD